MPNNRHLTLDDRSYIHSSLNAGSSFRKIANYLDKDPSTISKEVRKRKTRVITNNSWHIHNKCIHRKGCTVTGICINSDCRRSFCRSCKECNKKCEHFLEEHCKKLLKAPYVCNGCKDLNKCTLTRYVYHAAPADRKYRFVLTESRQGVSFTKEELEYLDRLVTPRIKKKQSLHHICATQANEMLCCERTLYRLIELNVLTACTMDLPRKVRYRPRKKQKTHKVDKKCRINRTFEDFKTYINDNPDIPVVQMDTVEGIKGGKVILTIHFTQTNLMLMYLRDNNTAQSVIDVFNNLYMSLGEEDFMRLFPILLGDNGSEFSNPSAIEYDSAGKLRTRVFYCNPSSPHEKPEIERNHEFIRMVLPKGTSFNHLVQRDIDLLACHINSVVRKKLNDMSPITAFSFFHGESILHKLGLKAIAPEDVMLSPSLLTSSKKGAQL